MLRFFVTVLFVLWAIACCVVYFSDIIPVVIDKLVSLL